LKNTTGGKEGVRFREIQQQFGGNVPLPMVYRVKLVKINVI